MDILSNSYDNEDKENDEPEMLEQFQASSILDGGDGRDSMHPGLKDFDGPSETTFPDGRPVDISTYDPSGYLASPDGSLIMIRKANSGRMSPVMGKSVKDYEEKMKVLRQENFDLRLLCYHLEQKLKDETVSKDELSIKRYTVQLETEQTKLQQQLSNKNELLKSASSAMDSLKAERDALQAEVEGVRIRLAEAELGPEPREAGDVARLEETNAALRDRLASSESQVRELTGQLAESRRSDDVRWSQAQERDEFEEELHSLNKKYERAVKAIQGFIKKVTQRDKEIEQLRRRLGELSGQEQDSGIKQSHLSDSSINTEPTMEADDAALRQQLQQRQEECQAAEEEARALRSRLAEAERSLSRVVVDLERERADRERTELALRRQEADRERQLGDLQAALALQETHVTALTNRTEGASSALAGFEAVVAERARHLEEVLGAREQALAEAAVQLRQKQEEVDWLRAQLPENADAAADNAELQQRLDKTEAELARLRGLLHQAEAGLASELAQERSEEEEAAGRSPLRQEELSSADLHAEVARLRGLLTEKEERLERLGTPRRGVGQRLFALHALPVRPGNPLSASAPAGDPLSTSQLQQLHAHIFSLLQELERTQHLQESFFGDLLTTANESLLHHQQSTSGPEPAAAEESGDQSISSLSGLSFLLSRLPRTPGGLQGGNVTMTTEGVTMTEEMHELVFERLRDQVDQLRCALAACSEQGHSLLRETVGLGSPVRLALDSEDWSALIRRLLVRLEREQGSESVHKDVRLAVGLCQQILRRLDRDDGVLSTSDLMASPAARSPVVDELSKTVGLVRTRCHALEAENRQLRERLDDDEKEMTFVSPFSSARRSLDELGTDHESVMQNITGLERERSALESELSRFRDLLSGEMSTSLAPDSALDSQVEEVTQRLRAMQLDLSVRMQEGTPRRDKSLLCRETEEARRRADSLASAAAQREVECERLRCTAADLRRRVATRCDDLELARLRSDAADMAQRHSILASDLQLETERRAAAEREVERLRGEMEAAREATRRTEAELGDERSRLRQEIAELSAAKRRQEEQRAEEEAIQARIAAIRAQMSRLETENASALSRADDAERRLSEAESRWQEERAAAAEKAVAMEALVSDLMAEKASLLGKLDLLQAQFRASGQEAEQLAAELVAQTTAMQTEMSGLARDKAELERRRTEQESRVATLMRNKEETEGRLTALIRNEEEQEARLAALALAKQEAEAAVRLLMRTKDELETRLTALVDDKEELADRLTAAERAKEEAESRHATVMHDKAEAEMRLAALVLVKEQAESEHAALSQEKAEMEGRHAVLSQEKEQVVARLAAEEEQVAVLLQEKEQMAVRLAAEEEQVAVLLQEKEQVAVRLAAEVAAAAQLQERVRTLVGENARLQEEAGTAEARGQVAEQQRLRAEAQVAAVEEEKEALEAEGGRWKSLVAELRLEAGHCEARMKEEQQDLQQETQRLRAEMAAMTTEQERLTEENEQLVTVLQELKRGVAQWQESAAEMERRLAESESEVSEKEDSLAALQRQFAEAAAERSRAESRAEALEREMAELRRSLDAGSEEARTLLTLKDELERRLAESDRAMAALRQENAETAEHLERMKPELASLRCNLSSVSRHRADLKSSLERLHGRVRASLAEQKAALTSRGLDTATGATAAEEGLDLRALEVELHSACDRMGGLQQALEQREADLSAVHTQLAAARARAVAMETQLAADGEEKAALRGRVHELELEARVPTAEELRETGEMVRRLEARVHELLTENQRWKSAAKELRGKLDARTGRLETSMKQNARLKALIKADEQQAEERRADLETLTSNVQHKNDAIARLQLQLKGLQREVETSRQRAVTDANNSALPAHLTADEVEKEAPRRAALSGDERALSPALSDVLSSQADDESALRLSPDRSCLAAYLDDVRHLRANLEASIAENDRLRAALQRQLASARHDDARRLRERLQETQERLELANGEVELLRRELDGMKELVRSCKAELELCRPRAEGSSVRREIVLESQRLRLQMERSIESNRRLHAQLKEQLAEMTRRQSLAADSRESCSPHAARCSPVASTPRQAQPQDLPTKLSACPDSELRLLHAIGRLDDLELVRKQVKETLCLMQSVRRRIDDRVPHCRSDASPSVDVGALRDLESDVKNVIYYLEEEDRLMGRFWVAELPPRDQHGRYFDPALQAQLAEAQGEAERLRGSNRLLQKLLSQQEERMAETDRARSELECAIAERLSSTEHVLSAARDNFKRVADNKAERMNKTS